MENKTKCFQKILPLFLFFTVFFVMALYSQDAPVDGKDMTQGMPPQGENVREKKAPPKEAIDACLGKKPQDACECNGPRGLMKGTCDYTPDKKYFACKPAGMRPKDAKLQENKEN